MMVRLGKARAWYLKGMHEYRVLWRRAGWSRDTKDKTRRFVDEGAMRAFVDGRLRGGDRPELSPLSRLVISRREVTPWEVLEL